MNASRLSIDWREKNVDNHLEENKMNDMVSIIVPVYNVQRYLLDCLDSILGQTYQNWECYLIDDGSTDESGKICDDYAGKDQRIKVLHKENGGVSSARNLALKNIGGYLIFVDSDDFIDSQFIEIAVKKMNDNDADVIQFGYTRDADKLGDNRDSADRFSSWNDIANDTLRFRIVQPMLWAKIYRVESVQSMPFIDGCNTLEDVEWLTRVMQNHSFVCSDYIGYYL